VLDGQPRAAVPTYGTTTYGRDDGNLGSRRSGTCEPAGVSDVLFANENIDVLPYLHPEYLDVLLKAKGF